MERLFKAKAYLWLADDSPSKVFRYLLRLIHGAAVAGLTHSVTWEIRQGLVLLKVGILKEKATELKPSWPKDEKPKLAEWKVKPGEGVWEAEALSPLRPDGPKRAAFVIRHPSGLFLAKPSEQEEWDLESAVPSNAGWLVAHSESGNCVHGVASSFQAARRDLLAMASTSVDWTQSVREFAANPIARAIVNGRGEWKP